LTVTTTRIQQLEVARLRAKREYHLAAVKLIEEKLAAVEPLAANADRQQIDLTVFNPIWKKGGRGSNLSTEGETAIIAAYDRFLSQNRVAALFQISSTAAHNWHQKWKMRRAI
jgi:hypothetical protein